MSNHSAWQTAVVHRRPKRTNSLHWWQRVNRNVKWKEPLGHFSRYTQVAHLTQLFVQSGGPGLGCRVALRAEHLLVPVDEVAVAQSDHLHAAGQTIERGMWFLVLISDQVIGSLRPAHKGKCDGGKRVSQLHLNRTNIPAE